MPYGVSRAAADDIMAGSYYTKHIAYIQVTAAEL